MRPWIARARAGFPTDGHGRAATNGLLTVPVPMPPVTCEFQATLVVFTAFFAIAGLAAAGVEGVGDALLPRRGSGKGPPAIELAESFFKRQQGSIGC